MKNKIPYNVFHKWYKDARNKMLLAQVEGLPIKLTTVEVSSGS